MCWIKVTLFSVLVDDYNGDVFYMIFPIRNTPAESQILINMVDNTTMNSLTNGQEFEYTKAFIDDTTQVQKKTSESAAVVSEKGTVFFCFLIFFSFFSFFPIKDMIWHLLFSALHFLDILYWGGQLCLYISWTIMFFLSAWIKPAF